MPIYRGSGTAGSGSSIQTYAEQAAASATDAAASASSASASESAASASATAAASSASSASTSASNAATSETNAATSETNAATSETNAATSETNAAASYDQFDDRFLGAKASDPALDNDGNALLTGALYWNTTNSLMMIYNGAAWIAITATTFPNVVAAVQASNTEIDILDGATVTTAELNLLDGVTATTAELNYVDVTTAGTAQASKAVVLDANKDIASIQNIKTVAETITFTSEYDNGNSGTADTINWGNSQKQKSTLTGNCTYTFTAPDGPGNFMLKVIQDGTGSRTVTWPATVKWPAGTAPTLSTAASAVDLIAFYYDGTNYYGQAGLNYS